MTRVSFLGLYLTGPVFPCFYKYEHNIGAKWIYSIVVMLRFCTIGARNGLCDGGQRRRVLRDDAQVTTSEGAMNIFARDILHTRE